MNNKYKKIMEIANFVGLSELAIAAATSIEKVNSRDKLHIAFIGGQNSGKTTMINAIVGKEVREPSTISREDELPLRISFEKTEEDPRFECIDIYNNDWNEENANIYEFKTSDVVESGKTTKFVDEFDVVFYLVSAMNPFTSEDVSVIKALSNHKIILILTKLDAIDEENREGVIKYVTDMGIRYGLNKPIIIDRSNRKDASKTIRDALPLFSEQKKYKDAYCDSLINELITAIKERIDNKISELDEGFVESRSSDTKKNMYSKALKTKNEIIELGNARSKRFDNSSAFANELSKKLIESGRKNSYSDLWKANIKENIIEPLIFDRFNSENEKIKKSLFEDCCGVNPTYEESNRLKGKIEEISKISAYISDINSDNVNLKNKASSINKKTVGVTAAVVAGALLIPMPTLASWIISVGAIAIGTGSIINDKNKEETAMWDKNIKDYSNVVAKQFYERLKIYINEIYEKLADYMYKTILNECSDTLEQNQKFIAAEKEKYYRILDELK